MDRPKIRTLAVTPQILADALRIRRKNLGYTQAQVASIVGLNPKSVSNIENKPQTVSIETLFKLLAALGLELTVSERAETTNRATRW